MKRSFLLFLLIISLPSLAVETANCKTKGNQLELNACALDDFKRADKELNETYQKLIKKEMKDPVFISKLRNAQRAWVAFRDAELESAFPCKESNSRQCWGSMHPMQFANYKALLTRERSKRLKQMLSDGQTVHK